jgi:hypothetical protein
MCTHNIHVVTGYGDDLPPVDDPSAETKKSLYPDSNGIDIPVPDISEANSNQSISAPSASKKKARRAKKT